MNDRDERWQGLVCGEEFEISLEDRRGRLRGVIVGRSLMDSIWITGFGEFSVVCGGLLRARALWKDGKKLGGGREEIQAGATGIRF